MNHVAYFCDLIFENSVGVEYNNVYSFPTLQLLNKFFFLI